MPKGTKKSAAGPPEKTGEKDVSSNTIGNDNKNVAIGDHIKQIINEITVNVPVLPFLVLIGLVLAIAAFIGLRLLGPAQMSGSFNLAVAEFGQTDANGRVVSSQKGQLISQRLYQGLEIEFNSLSPADQANFHPQVWQDSMNITQKRVTIGIIPGDTPQARWSAACALAQKIHAGVMIYGSLPADGSTAVFTPEFAICNNPGLRVDADEIVGTHQVIDGLPAALINEMGRPDTDLAVNLRVNSWTSALSQFSIGIMYDLLGRSDLALGIFQKARDQMSAGADPVGEVLWFFIGREELILADSSGPNAASQQRSDHLANAQAAFEQALKINPLYARAHIGLGGVDFERAQATVSSERLKSPDLAAAIQEYTTALSEAPGSPGALIETKARLGLVSTWILQGEAQRDSGQPSAAESTFNQAIQTASAALQPLMDAKEYRVLAQGYLSLGEAYHEQGNLKLQEGDKAAAVDLFEKASANYEGCIQQVAAVDTDQTLANTIVAGLCVPNKKSVDDSLTQLKG